MTRRARALLIVLASVAVAWSAAPAYAGLVIQPAAGSTTGSQPTFLVNLDAQDSLATVYVASTAAMSSSGLPAQKLGSCTPTTPFGEVDKYTCQPSSYSPSLTSSLPPGTYYWWMTFYRTDPGNSVSTIHISGPLSFTVPAAVAPTNTYLVSPLNGGSVSATPRLTINAPASASLHFYVSAFSDRSSDGSPAVGPDASCTSTTTASGLYHCDVGSGKLTPGLTYYWWVVVTVANSKWTYGPRSMTVSGPSSGGGSGGGGTAQAHNVTYAPYLHSSSHYTGSSVKQTRLSRAAYGLSKILGAPKTIAVACWGTSDWSNISGDNPESHYSLLGFYWTAMPHWVNLSPGICRTFETLLYHRPQFTNVVTADALDTLTHEMIHALGLASEARTECFSMQLSFITGISMGLPSLYAENLDRLSLRNYHGHPPAYVDDQRCREDGAWDLFPRRDSLPWHMPAV